MVEELGADCEGPARLRPPRPRRDGELRRLPAHARGDPALARRHARALGELAVPGRRGDRRALVAARAAAAAAPRRPAAAAGDGGGLGGGGRGGRGRLHAHLVGRASASAVRDARGADRRPGDVASTARPRSSALVQALCAAPPPPSGGAASCSPRSSRRRASSGRGSSSRALREPLEALRQLEVGSRDGLEAVAADLVRRSRP